MGRKDIEEKMFEDYNDVFADIVNVLLFGGKQVIRPSELENSKDKSRFKTAEGKTAEQERDVSKWWRRSKIRLALFGLENQTKSDSRMCLRLIGYDGAVYRSEYEDKTVYPVITLVLYLDHERHWNGPKTLLESLDVPDELIPYVNDYRMNLFEIAWLTEEQVGLFKSDFKIVADYFVQLRKTKDYIPNPKTIKHVDAVLKLMAALTGDARFEEAIKDIPARERRHVTMCKVLDDAEKRGEKRARFQLITNLVGTYILKNKLTQKAACEELSIDYKEYQAAKRYMKRMELQG